MTVPTEDSVDGVPTVVNVDGSSCLNSVVVPTVEV